MATPPVSRWSLLFTLSDILESINIKGYCSSLASAPCYCLSVSFFLLSVAPVQAYEAYNVCSWPPFQVILTLILTHLFLLPLLPITISSALLALSHVQATYTLLTAMLPTAVFFVLLIVCRVQAYTCALGFLPKLSLTTPLLLWLSSLSYLLSSLFIHAVFYYHHFEHAQRR